MAPTLYREIRPSARLAPFVECYWTRADAPGAGPHRVLPDGCVDIVYSRQRNEPESLNIAGLMTASKWILSVPGRTWFGVRFHPAMATAFIPHAAELKDKIEPCTGSLFDRLASAAELETVAAVMESVLQPVEIPRFSEARSERQRRRVCVARCGVAPKYLSRILRFRRAMESIGTAQPNWAQFAAAHGYHDQAHFIRECQEFAGCTPGRYLQYTLPAAS